MRHIFSFAITLCVVGGPAAPAIHAQEQTVGETDSAGQTAVDEGVPSRIRRMTSELGYDSEVGDLFVEFVETWRLPELKQRIDNAEQELAEGHHTPADVARTQSEVLEQIRRYVRATFKQVDIGPGDYSNEFHHLQRILETKQSQCVGDTQLYIVLGSAVGLDARAIDVIFPSVGCLDQHVYHIAPVVRLADGRVRIVDDRGEVYSPPFVFSKHYKRHGLSWKLIDQANPLRLHRQVRPLDLSEVRAHVLLSTASSFFNSDRSHIGRPLVDTAFQLSPDSSCVLLAMARWLEFKDGAVDEAEAFLKKALENDPDRANCCGRYAEYLLRKGRLREAQPLFNRAIKLLPESPDTLVSRAYCHHYLEERLSASKDVARALRIAPNHMGALALRAELRTWEGDLEGALVDADFVLERDPKSYSALHARMNVRMRRGECEAAERDCDSLLAIDPGVSVVWSARGLCRSHLGRLHEAMEDYCKAVELAPGDYQVLANMGYLHLEFGEPAKALADCDAALKAKPDYELALFNRGVALAQLGRKTEARESIERSVKAAPETQERAEVAIKRFGL
jgi:tetratricopeptide (TPR) repeat protein